MVINLKSISDENSCSKIDLTPNDDDKVINQQKNFTMIANLRSAQVKLRVEDEFDLEEAQKVINGLS